MKVKPDNKRLIIGCIAATVAFLGLLAWWIYRLGNESEVSLTDTQDISQIEISTAIELPNQESSQHMPPDPHDGLTCDAAKEQAEKMPDRDDDQITQLIRDLNLTSHSDQRRVLLKEIAAWLKSLPRDEAVRFIVGFLDSGVDFDLGLPFRVGPGGNLRSHPTLRVAMLDWLGQIDPMEAALYARRVFEESKVADEWALAIRNYGRTIEPGEDAYFSAIVQQLITNQDWRNHPSGGYLEAFDAVVFNEQFSLLPEIISMVGPDSNLAPVAVMALDELVQHNRAAAFRHLHQASDELSHLPPMLRANLMVRADIRGANQRQIIEAYLADPNLTHEEKQEFCRIFPNFSRHVGYRLLTTNRLMTMAEMAQVDAAALEASEEWMNDERYIDLEPHIRMMKYRLQKNLASARNASFRVPETQKPE